jgi:hypothetical protein
MSEDVSSQRLANRLADLRKLGDRNREAHPVSVLRKDIVGHVPVLVADSSAGSRAGSAGEPTVEQRAEALARRLLSPVLARAEQLANTIRGA